MNACRAAALAAALVVGRAQHGPALAAARAPEPATHSAPAPPSGPAPRPLLGQTPEQRARVIALSEQWAPAITAQDWAAAERLLRQSLAIDPRDHIAHYNLAIALAALGKAPDAEAALQRAVTLGFTDIAHIERDALLGPLRASVTFRAILDGWDELQTAVAADRAALYAKALGRRYRVTTAPELRLMFVTALSPPSERDLRAQLHAVTRWWTRAVLPEGTPAVAPGPERPDPWVLVVVPDKDDYQVWARLRFGVGAQDPGAPAQPGSPAPTSTVGGVYDHDTRELVAADAGGLLRHEYAHVLHWRHMARTAKVHPLWVQEGLCSLVEDVSFPPAWDDRDRPPEQDLTPLPSWRTNTARNMLQSGSLPPLQGLLALDPQTFLGSRPLGNYAAARSLLLMLDQRGLLGQWYSRFSQDPRDGTGAAALTAVLNAPLTQIERDWRSWIAALEHAPDQSSSPAAQLPAALEPTPEGLVVTRAINPPTPPRRSATSLRSPLERSDLLLDIEDQPVRDRNELARALADHKPGDALRLRVRRDGQPAELVAVLIRPTPQEP